MSKGEPTAEGRAEAAKVVNTRLKDLRLTVPELIALTGLAGKTVRDVINKTGNPSRGTLVVIAVSLGFSPPYYLDNLIRGKVTENVTIGSPLEVHLASRLAEVGVLRTDIAGLTENVAGLANAVHGMDRKIEMLIGRQHLSDENPSSD